MRNTVSLVLTVLFFGSCNSAAPKKPAGSLPYFDLKGFIDAEAKRLRLRQSMVDKTVKINDTEEHKQLRITDWQKELSAFSDADINKAAWEGLFSNRKTKNGELFSSAEDKVPVKSVLIEYRQGKISKIQVLNSSSNALYSSNDTLLYFPDSLYEIRKTQRIKLLNEKNYRITGRFK